MQWFWHRNCTQCTDWGSCAGGCGWLQPCTLSAFYLFRKKLKHFWVFFLLHPAVVVFATLMVKSWPVGAVAIAVLGVFYGLHSIRLRVQSGDTTGVPGLQSGSGGDRTFLVCSYKQSQTDCMLVLGSFFVWSARNTDQALCGQLSFLCKNKCGQCRCDSEKIFSDRNYVVALYSVVCRPADCVLYDLLWIKLTEGAIWLGKILRWLIVWC